MFHLNVRDDNDDV